MFAHACPPAARLVATLALFLLAPSLSGCSDGSVCPGPDCPGCPGPTCGWDDEAGGGKADGEDKAAASGAGDLVLYEVQARAANACHPDVGSPAQREACRAKVAPEIPYRADGMRCGDLDWLKAIRLGTLEDLREPSADFHEGITLRYIDERVGANAVWLMPVFPNNDTWSVPSACDDLGSPYAVRDYLHVRGTLSRACIEEGRDEYDAAPCWGNDALDAVIADAHARGLKVFLDLAFNHLGHNYLFYDGTDVVPTRERIARGEDLDRLWDFAATFDEALLAPEILDEASELEELARRDPAHRARLDEVRARCPALAGDELVRAYNVWREALDWEREAFRCDALYLEHAAPGFYVGANRWDPSRGAGDNFSGEAWSPWPDVKFLFHHGENRLHGHEYVRNREVLFRVMNYWTSRGVDGFRLDHTTDSASGIDADDWRYVLGKVAYYAERRGGRRPIFLAEEFFDQQPMSQVVDVMTEGYVHDMTGRDGVVKDAARLEGIVANLARFEGRTLVMTALETHDEHRLVDGTGFTRWTGAGFWGIGAATASVPMLLMGQEFGEPWGLEFRRSAIVRGRFEGTPNHAPDGDALVDFYRSLIEARLRPENRALRAAPVRFLRTRDSGGARPDPRILAMVKASGDGNVVFAFHNLWEQDVAQAYFVPPDVADALWLRDGPSYRLVDVLTGLPRGTCRPGADLKWDLPVSMDAGTRVLWLRLERCE